jgi:hypothetical protein
MSAVATTWRIGNSVNDFGIVKKPWNELMTI